MPTWTHEQTAGATGGGDLGFGSNVKAGSLLIAMYEEADSGSLADPTDTLGNDYILLKQTITTNSQRVAWWYAIANGAGANTVSFPTGTFAARKVSEWSLDAGEPTQDGSALSQYVNAPSGTDVLASPAATVAENDSLVLGLFGSDDAAGGTVTAGTGFTMRDVTALASSANDRFAYESAVMAAGSRTVLFSLTVPLSGEVNIAVFQAPAAPPQKLRPDADIVTTGWSTAPLWSKIDEESADGTVITATAS